MEAAVILCMILAAMLGLSAAINYFWQTGLKRAAAYALFVIGVFLLFWASGLWIGASRHSWGVLVPVFILMIVGAALAVRFLPGLAKLLLAKIRKIIEQREGQDS